METATEVAYNNRLFKFYLPIYDWVELLLRGVRAYAIKDIELSPGAEVLDVACGTGFLTGILVRKGYDTSAVDVSPDMLALAKRRLGGRHNAHFYLQSATTLPFADSSFDLVGIAFSLHDMPRDVGVEILREMVRVAKNGSEILVMDYWAPNAPLLGRLGQCIAGLWESHHYKKFLEIGIEPYLTQAGLAVERRKTFLGGAVEYVVCRKKGAAPRQ